MSVDIKAVGDRLETGTPRPLFQLSVGLEHFSLGDEAFRSRFPQYVVTGIGAPGWHISQACDGSTLI